LIANEIIYSLEAACMPAIPVYTTTIHVFIHCRPLGIVGPNKVCSS